MPREHDDFEWGPLAKGTYIGLLWLTLVVGWHYSQFVFHYVFFLVFLGLFLKPLLVAIGVPDFLSGLIDRTDDVRWKKRTERRRAEIERRERDESYRHRRVKDPRLPKNW